MNANNDSNQETANFTAADKQYLQQTVADLMTRSTEAEKNSGKSNTTRIHNTVTAQMAQKKKDAVIFARSPIESSRFLRIFGLEKMLNV